MLEPERRGGPNRRAGAPQRAAGDASANHPPEAGPSAWIVAAAAMHDVGMGTILVAYATKHGSTEEVAEEIAFTLCDLGWRVDLRSAREVRKQIKDDVLVVLGGAIYSGRLHPDARRFLKRHRRELLKVPVAVFGMGPLGLEKEAWERSRAQLARNLAKQAWLRPARMTVFGGVDPRKPRWDVDRDLRDWEAIRSWARELPKIVAKPGSAI